MFTRCAFNGLRRAFLTLNASCIDAGQLFCDGPIQPDPSSWAAPHPSHSLSALQGELHAKALRTQGPSPWRKQS